MSKVVTATSSTDLMIKKKSPELLAQVSKIVC